MKMMFFLAPLALFLAHVSADCPYAKTTLPSEGEPASLRSSHERGLLQDAAESVDYGVVKADIKLMLTKSEAWWPADWPGTYGPLMIRLAWHCSGSYRTSDGRGGCDGARIRFEPELSWADNTNLDKARKLLVPIKDKYPGLSWGDLIVLAGTTAIESMGGPVLGFCGGRIDDPDGYASLELGPSVEQQALAPCEVNGQCMSPLGTNTIGLIYVNPAGPMGNAKPQESAPQIRFVFNRMGMNDSETVALIGGGHTFGMMHGACKEGPGPSPKEDPLNPWPGMCGTGADKGKGVNTFTSGFEGTWTNEWTTWSAEFFQNLLDYDYVLHTSDGGNPQYMAVQRKGGREVKGHIMMLTSDLALINDEIYLGYVQRMSKDLSSLGKHFEHAWYKLTTRDMGPVSRCLGNLVPPPQPFQHYLPDPPRHLANFTLVRLDIKHAMRKLAALEPDMVDGLPYYGALFATLAWRCAATFRATDYQGGCNGARIRLSPQRDWEVNAGMDQVLAVLSDIKTKWGSGLSWADLIVLAGQTAIEDAGGDKMRFCPGRVDADAGGNVAWQEWLKPRKFVDPILEVRDNAKIAGLTMREAVVLSARLRSPTQQARLGYFGTWTDKPSKLSKRYFATLLSQTWTRQDTPAGKEQYKATGVDLYAMPTDMAIVWDKEFQGIAKEYIKGEKAVFFKDFSAAWSKVMNADRFDGPGRNLCDY